MRNFLCAFAALMCLFSCKDESTTGEIMEVTKIVLNESKIDFFEGDTQKLEASLEPNNTSNVTLTWSSADETIAQVEEGLVTGVAAGETKITVTAPNGVSATCEVKVRKMESVETIDFEPVCSHVTLKEFKNNKYYWTIKFEDQTAYDSYQANNKQFYEEGTLLQMELASSEATFNHGIPVGDFVVGATDTDPLLLSMKRTKYVKGSSSDTNFKEGSLKISRADAAYEFVFDGVKSVYTQYDDIFTADTKDADRYIVTNHAYLSTITGNLDRGPEYTKALVFRSEPYFYEIFLAEDGVEISNTGTVYGEGEYIQLWIATTPEQPSINGTFTIKNPNEVATNEAFAYQGEMSFYTSNTTGAWFFEFVTTSDAIGVFNKNLKQAPLLEGDIKISIDDLTSLDVNKAMTLTIESTDDAKPTGNKITVNYEGNVIYNDSFRSGDFYNAKGYFYGIYGITADGKRLADLTDNVENMNWTLMIDSEELNTSGGVNGNQFKFDFMASPDANYKDGLPAGVYTIESSPSYDAGTVHDAEVWVFKDGESTNESNIKIVSGTITVEKLNNVLNQTKVTIDALDANGSAITGSYTGTLNTTNSATPFMSNHVFETAGATADVGYMGNHNGLSNWSIELYEDSYYSDKTNGSGLIISLDLFTEGKYKTELPTGTFELKDPAFLPDGAYDFSKAVPSILNTNHTAYYNVYHGGAVGTDFLIKWTEGKITISKDEATGEYTIELDLHSTADIDGKFYDYAVTGKYVGTIDPYSMDPSNPLSTRRAPYSLIQKRK